MNQNFTVNFDRLNHMINLQNNLMKENESESIDAPAQKDIYTDDFDYSGYQKRLKEYHFQSMKSSLVNRNNSTY